MKTVVVVGILGALTAVAAVVVARTDADQAPGIAVDAARDLLAAAESWQSAHGNACPTISELVEDGRLSDQARTDDAWGNRFRILCDGPKTTVVSAGPDRRVGTKDDFSVGRSSG